MHLSLRKLCYTYGTITGMPKRIFCLLLALNGAIGAVRHLSQGVAMGKTLGTQLLQFYKREQGNVFIIVGFAIMVLITATGVSVDMARAQTLQEKISTALDAAGLAAGATANTVDVQTQAQKYFNANFPNGYLGSSTITVSAVLSADKSTISLTASGTQATTFLQVVGIKTVSIGASSTITRANSGMELVLVLDNTGSMSDPVNSSDSSVSKLSAVQTAIAGSGGLLDIVYGTGNNTATNLWVGVVPFSYMVNIGTSYPTWIDTTANSDFGPVISGSSCPSYTGNPSGTTITATYNTSSSIKRCDYLMQGTNATTTNFGLSGNWNGCIDARNGTASSSYDASQSATSSLGLTLDESDDTPTTTGTSGTKFPPYFNATSSTTTSGSSPSYYCSTSGSPTNEWNCNISSGSGSSKKVTTVYYPVWPTNSTLTIGPNSTQNNNCTQTPLLPMVAEKSTVESTINAMTASGDTMINLGMAWGWRLLSPNWAGVWQGEMVATGNPTYPQLPLQYKTSLMNKVVVLMTDGVNNSSSTYPGGYQNQSSIPSISSLDSRTLAICSAMKNNGITIYTIGFGTADGVTVINSHCNNSSCATYVNGSLLQSCATNSSYYFLAPTNAQLATVFAQIGDALANLRVSQ